MSFEVTSTGNAGVKAVSPHACVFIDSFFHGVPSVGTSPSVSPESVTHADLLLVTHAHHDHFKPAAIVDVASRTKAVVVGPERITTCLRGKLPGPQLVEMEPAESDCGPARSVSITLPSAKITAFRTFHSEGHNSYLVETPDFRLFHDGDNEDTRRLDVDAIGRIDALFLCPWQGSGCSGFIRRLSPRYWFLIHMTDGELDEHEAGTFLPSLCEDVPPNVVALRPGQSFRIK
ncbi:MAG: hypothetical protein C0404_01040 [Verrucomicrobia bacterium]|nr:hypothetical protein [Verrucomicrobiota bacterium]